MKVLRSVTKAVKRKQVAIIVDGPNMLRKDLNVNLETIRKIGMDLGRPVMSVVILDRKASEKLVEAVNNAGFRAIISTGKVEVDFTIAAMEAIATDKINTIVLVTRSAAYLPIVHKAKESGKETVVIGTEPGFSVALRKSADISISLAEGSPSLKFESDEEESYSSEGEENLYEEEGF